MQIEIRKVKLSQIKLNPNNPRLITDKDMGLLIKSLKEFPEMMQLREIIVDETLTVLGGNMRTLALRKIGEKECIAKIVSGLTPTQKREFIIKDNSAFGSWDMDILANLWGDLPLTEWGMNISESWVKPDESVLSKNFNQGKGAEEEYEQKELAPGKYPITFVLDQNELKTWESIKAKLKLSDDKTAFLRIIGGKNA